MPEKYLPDSNLDTPLYRRALEDQIQGTFPDKPPSFYRSIIRAAPSLAIPFALTAFPALAAENDPPPAIVRNVSESQEPSEREQAPAIETFPVVINDTEIPPEFVPHDLAVIELTGGVNFRKSPSTASDVEKQIVLPGSLFELSGKDTVSADGYDWQGMEALVLVDSQDDEPRTPEEDEENGYIAEGYYTPLPIQDKDSLREAQEKGYIPQEFGDLHPGFFGREISLPESSNVTLEELSSYFDQIGGTEAFITEVASFWGKDNDVFVGENRSSTADFKRAVYQALFQYESLSEEYRKVNGKYTNIAFNETGVPMEENAGILIKRLNKAEFQTVAARIGDYYLSFVVKETEDPDTQDTRLILEHALLLSPNDMYRQLLGDEDTLGEIKNLIQLDPEKDAIERQGDATVLSEDAPEAVQDLMSSLPADLFSLFLPNMPEGLKYAPSIKGATYILEQNNTYRAIQKNEDGTVVEYQWGRNIETGEGEWKLDEQKEDMKVFLESLGIGKILETDELTRGDSTITLALSESMRQLMELGGYAEEFSIEIKPDKKQAVIDAIRERLLYILKAQQGEHISTDPANFPDMQDELVDLRVAKMEDGERKYSIEQIPLEDLGNITIAYGNIDYPQFTRLGASITLFEQSDGNYALVLGSSEELMVPSWDFESTTTELYNRYTSEYWESLGIESVDELIRTVKYNHVGNNMIADLLAGLYAFKIEPKYQFGEIHMGKIVGEIAVLPKTYLPYGDEFWTEYAEKAGAGSAKRRDELFPNIDDHLPEWIIYLSNELPFIQPNLR